MDGPIDIMNILQSSGRSRSIDDFPILQHYLSDVGSYPVIKSYSDCTLDQTRLMLEPDFKDCDKIFYREDINVKDDISTIGYAFVKIANGYFMEISSMYHPIEDYDIHEQLNSTDSNLTLVSQVVLLCPQQESNLYSKELEDRILVIFKKHRLKKNVTTPSIGMICQEEGDFYIKNFFINKNYSIVEGDLHYGKGFMNFHQSLLERFKGDTKGLVLFHGDPGTGKTYYIRCLMKELLLLDKYIIYLPPNMMDFMVSPEMISFISRVIIDKSDDNKSCIILIEDAEPLITSRKNGNRSDGITNLLNITDGLLNDMLNVQVIATFNTDLRNIDEALLRPERLIARKQFKKLSKTDTKRLLNYLHIEKEDAEEMTLAQIYSQHKHNEILVHEYSEASKIGFSNKT